MKRYLKNIVSGFLKLILFYDYDTEKKQVDKNECEYILFRVDVYFAKYLLATQIDEKQHVDRDLIFEQKIQEALEKLGCKFIRINTIK